MIVELLEKNIFKVITFEKIPIDAQLFNSQFINKIKNLGIKKVFEKSYLLKQAYNNKNKNLILI